MIDTAMRLFRQRGYEGTSWRTLVDEAGTPWGSIHHHFPQGKEQLGVEAVARASAGMLALIEQGFERFGSPARAIEAWCLGSAEQLERSGWLDGCPLATIALEVGGGSALAKATGSALMSWEAALARRFADAGIAPQRASELATVTLAGVEGALLLARASRSTAPLLKVGRHLRSVLEDAVSPKGRRARASHREGSSGTRGG